MRIGKKRITACLLSAALLLFTSMIPVQASTALEESIKQKQQAISDAQSEKKKIQSNISDIKSMVSQLQKSKKDLENKIEDLKEEITAKKTEIEETKADMELAQGVADQQYEDMKTRLRYLYRNGKGNGYLDLLVNAGSFADMLNQAGYVEQLSSYDSRKLEEYRQSVEYLELCKQTLEEEEDVLNTAQASLEKEQQAVNTLISEKEQQIVAYQGDISNKEAAIKEYEADISAQNATIAALEKAVAADKAKLEEENRLKYDGGMFQMPCPGYTRISDDYGNRMHPTLKVQKFHNGVDFAAPSGTAILAAYSGNVVAASYNSSMGNYVMIDHGDGLYTIYMHASKLYVSTGQSVSKGATIAAVGSTGRSTGPHLHFSVRSNGSYVSPWNYLK